MTLLYLILGHLLADFVLQPGNLVAWKQRSWKGSAMHALVHFLTSCLLFLPFLNLRIVVVVALIALLHFWIDNRKVLHEKKSKKIPLLFLLDQLGHAMVLMVGAFLIGGIIPVFAATGLMRFYFNPLTITYLNFAVVLSFAWEILQFQFKRINHSEVRLKFNQQQILVRLFWFSAAYGVAVLFLWHDAALSLLG